MLLTAAAPSDVYSQLDVHKHAQCPSRHIANLVRIDSTAFLFIYFCQMSQTLWIGWKKKEENLHIKSHFQSFASIIHFKAQACLWRNTSNMRSKHRLSRSAPHVTPPTDVSQKDPAFDSATYRAATTRRIVHFCGRRINTFASRD